ncbi:ABC transporter ATP-binding protein [Actinoplanes sp. HUAS TT8]|uniref:ABC transporter ATP-binding protein n=1 Tax=Actinoplanes sp. HUAS TT8 TaxID=3447453 RepID=UPI003F521B86
MTAAELRIQDLRVRIGAARLIHDVTVRCPPGSFVGLLGPNGSGKSTLLRTVYRALTPEAGTIRLDGRDLLTELSASEAARQVAVLAQEPGHEVGFTVAELVAAGRTPHHGTWSRETPRDREVVARSIAAVGLTGHEHRAFGTLSGGERQRVLLARALAQQPSVLILDEPTNHLDIGTQLGLLSLVRGLGVTVLAALHDLNLAAAYCDHLYLLRDGAPVAHGTPRDVLTPALIADVYGVTAHRIAHPDTGRPHLIFATHLDFRDQEREEP